MIHHVSFGTEDAHRAKTFYDPVMAVLGMKRIGDTESSLDYGVESITFSLETPTDGKPATAGNGTHIAFAAGDREMVDEFYRVALENGGRSGGAPGIRDEYDPNYYGAFVYDPDGNKLEAVTFSAQSLG